MRATGVNAVFEWCEYNQAAGLICCEMYWGGWEKAEVLKVFLILGLAELYIPLMLMLYTITFSDLKIQTSNYHSSAG